MAENRSTGGVNESATARVQVRYRHIDGGEAESGASASWSETPGVFSMQFGRGVVPRGSAAEQATLLVGRALLGGFFLYNGVNHFLNTNMLAGYAESKHVPWPRLAVLASGTMLVAGGLSVLLGVRPKIGASLVAGFLAGVTPSMHAFWTLDDPQARAQELVQFTKNVALAGGAALAAAIPEPWSASLGR